MKDVGRNTHAQLAIFKYFGYSSKRCILSVGESYRPIVLSFGRLSFARTSSLLESVIDKRSKV